MSRGYRVVVAPLVTAQRDVKGEDALCIDVSLLPILGDEAMRQRLLAALGEDGWTPTDDGGREKDLGKGLTATIDCAGQSVTVTQTIARTVTAQAVTQQAAEAQAAERAALSKDAARREATTTLARAEGDVRAALEGAIQRIYLAALEEKARSLGQVESIQHGVAADGSVEVTIKVRA